MKKKILVLFGGQSSEHVVSCMSAVNVIKNIDASRYETVLIGITEDGRWLLTDSVEAIEDGSWREGTVSAFLLPDARRQCVLVQDKTGVREIPVDAAFPVLHGLYGEDGTVQGLFELARIPYVGCGVRAGSARRVKRNGCGRPAD